jgi:hypothetical protein
MLMEAGDNADAGCKGRKNVKGFGVLRPGHSKARTCSADSRRRPIATGNTRDMAQVTAMVAIAMLQVGGGAGV